MMCQHLKWGKASQKTQGSTTKGAGENAAQQKATNASPGTCYTCWSPKKSN